MIKNWFLALRPKTLTASLVPVLVGSAVASRWTDNFELWISVCALLSASMIQIATNFFNDAIDFRKGADTEQRLGPTRVTQAGLLTARQVMRAGVICLIMAICFGVPLVLRGGWPIVVLGLISLFLAYAYTGGPFPLAYRGWGDFFVFLFFGLIAVGGVVYLHLGFWPWDAVVAGAQTGLLGTVLIAINNFRDRDQDLKVGKKTMAARFGARFARIEIVGLFLTAYLLCIWWYLAGKYWAMGLPLLSLPLAVQVAKGIVSQEPSVRFNQYLAQAAGAQFLFGSLLSAGLIL